MANVQHSSLTDPEIHEPKGVASASNGEVYVADGAGSGAWATAQSIGAASSHGANGYTYIPGGLIIQWGYQSVSTTTTTVTYSIPFPTACYSFTCTAYDAGDTGGTSFEAALRSVPGTSTASLTTDSGIDGVYWVAIGK